MNKKNKFMLITIWALCLIGLAICGLYTQQRTSYERQISELQTELAHQAETIDKYEDHIYMLHIQRGRALAELERAREAE